MKKLNQIASRIKTSPGQNSFAERVQNIIKVRLQLLAKILSKKWENINKRTKILTLVSYCLLFGSTCIYIIIQSLQKGNNKIPLNEIKSPILVNSNDSIKFENNLPQIGGIELKRINIFKSYMDSLKYTENGKQLYDSITIYRKGLLDSIKQLDSIYNQLNNR